MITVPSCEPCNSKFKLDDEYFRIFVTAGAEPGSKLERLWREKVVNSSLRNSPALSVMLGKDREAFVRQYKGTVVQSTTGRVLRDDEHYLVQPLTARRINDVVLKIVRGLHYHEFKRHLPANTAFAISTQPSAQILSNFIDSPTGHVGNDNEFVYHVESLDEFSSRWLLRFYERHVFEIIAMLQGPDRLLAPLPPSSYG